MSEFYTRATEMKHTILCVDDETDNVEALERLFRRQYRVLKATSGREALDLLAKNQVTVIISDQRMPQMSGVEFLADSIKTHPSAIRILLTGYTDIDSVISAINAGQIYRYVTKPWDPVDLSNAVDKAVDRYEIGEELREKNAALQRALDELKTLDEAKSSFMILINHELKTPLTSILSFSDLLSETSLDGDQKMYLSRVKTAALRLQELVNDSLEMISAETGQMKLDKRLVKSKGLVPPFPEAIQAVLNARKVQIVPEIENQDVLADEKIVRNVLRRLLHNAAKFADSGTDVAIKGESDGKGAFRITIINRGAPLDERKIRRILQPFTLNESILNHSTGTGLGLSVCQALLRLHGSSLEFHCADHEIRVSFTVDTA